MSPTLRLVLVFHNHQPVGNFDGVFEQAYQDSYLPFLDVLGQYPDLVRGELGYADNFTLLCGMAKAKYYLLTSDALSGAEAERIGLVSLAVDDAELDDKALAVATKLAESAPSAIRWTKHTMNHWLRQVAPIFDASLALEFIGFAGPEGTEGIDAFLQKRPPKFNPDSPF